MLKRRPRFSPQDSPKIAPPRDEPGDETGASDPEPQSWTRDETFAAGWNERPLSDFVRAPTPITWVDRNPYEDLSNDEIREWLLRQVRWRHHHGIADLRESPSVYSAYSDRVDTMLAMLDAALAVGGIDLTQSSFVDLAAAEGYAGNHLHDHGAGDIDSCDINPGCIERLWKIRAFTDRRFGRVGSIDLDHVHWSAELGRTYDVVLALGIIYHLENPMLFARNLRAITGKIAVVESDTPVFPANQRFRGWGNVYLHRDQVSLAPGNVRYLTEFRPDVQALAEILLAAGFARVERIPVVERGVSRYLDVGEKSVVVAFAN